MSVLKSKDGDELIITCDCGCGDTCHIKIEEDEPDYYFFLTYLNSNWYREQDDKILRVVEKKLRKIWAVIRGKDFHYSDIRMTRDEFELFREYINSIGE